MKIAFKKKYLLLLTVIFSILFIGILVGCPVDEKTTTTTTEVTTTTTTTTTITPLTWLKADTSDITLSSPTARNDGPEDWRDEIIYFIMTDRFKDGDTTNNPTKYMGTDVAKSYFGGDFKGIIDEVDYLRKLGMTSIWITPIVQNVRNEDGGWTGYHGYWAQDFNQVDSVLTSATNNDNSADKKDYYKSTFIKTMHDNGILVIQDIVVNHVGNIALYKVGVGGVTSGNKWNPPFKKVSNYERLFIREDSAFATATWVADEQREMPPYPFSRHDFFHNNGQIGDYSDADQVLYGDMSGLDDLATENPDVRDALLDAYRGWALCGVDGFRVDTVKHLEADFWDSFSPGIRDTINGDNPAKKFLQFGEALIGDHGKTKVYAQGNRLDSMLNFDLYFKIKSVFGGNSGTNLLTTELSSRKSNLRNTPIGNGGAEVNAIDGSINFIDNHDEGRFLTSATNEKQVRSMYVALTYIMTTKGIPCIYYNTENNVTGNKESSRVKMANFETKNKITFTLIKNLAKIRTANISLRRGDIKVLAEDVNPGIFAFVRYNGTASENVFVLLNTSGNEVDKSVDPKHMPLMVMC